MIYIGTDIYLTFDKQTKKEKEDQITGWSIDAGNKGYLRASIGMVLENSVLRGIFPSEYWESGKALPYDFNENWNKANSEIASYLMTKIMKYGKGLPQIEKEFVLNIDEKAKQAELLGKAINETMKNITNGEVKMCGEETSFESDVMWANSVLQFFRLGYEKQKAGLNPKVHISC